VFDQAALLLKARPELNGDTAYWMARRLVDLTLAQQLTEAAGAGPAFTPRMDEAPALMLAP
jgi:hypothetical protein